MDLTLPHLRETFEGALANADKLEGLTDYLRTEADVYRAGIGEIVGVFRRAQAAIEKISPAYEICVYESIFQNAKKKHPELERTVGFHFDEIRARFKEVEKRILTVGREKVAYDLLWRHITTGVSRGPTSQLTESGLINQLRSQQRPRVPIRDLLARAGNAIREMKPCLMMSPLSVAQFLPRDAAFDLVIMDEASQLRPEDALGAVMRGKQVVVVGDPKQLPPTSFFSFSDDKALSDDDDPDLDVDQESILDLGIRSFHPARRLKWHYRSRHESLIAFSNHAFYGDLVVFPSPFHGKDTHGITFVPVEGVYDKRRNLNEANRLVGAVAKMMEEHPKRSVGIVAMNQEQRDLIADLMDDCAAKDPIIQDYLQRWQGTLEPFFVKNLENVQGDERDVIVISTVYGKDPNGNFFQRFGPINGAMGHRRLNVLFTRAKYQMVVFSSIEPSMLHVDNNSSRGLKALRDFLVFAKEGRLDTPIPQETDHEIGSDFEIFVMGRLQEKGYEVVCQVGVAGYFLDLAVKHPHLPGQYALGIECDGATYHSARCHRDRDKTRQEILENLGWKIHRIWSTDWFRHPDREINRVLSVLPPLVR